MPYSFTKIEEDKTKIIGFVFFFLIVFYFLSFWFIILIIKNFAVLQSSTRYAYSSQASAVWTWLSLKSTLYIFLLSGIVGYCHWSYTTTDLINKILQVLSAEPLNLKDAYHKTYQNILEEVSVATGGQKFEGVVIPTTALNAFALQDFKGRAVIGVTEGMLARLNRAQLEAVVGHEAAHIVSGDCLATTVTSSLFELYNGLLKGLELMLRGGGRSTYRIRTSSRGGGGAIAFIFLVYALLAVTRLLSQIVRMFISRQREYRADAIAVRLTRDPLSLAEALYGMRYHWRGAGLSAQELEAIFIVNPKYSKLDELDGSIPDLFSTHPPIENRINILLNMAHADLNTVAQNIKKQEIKPRVSVPGESKTSQKAEGEYWMVNKDSQWQGPYDITQLMTFGWLHPEIWVKRLGGQNIQMLYQDTILSQKISGHQKEAGHMECPKCKVSLRAMDYEGVEVHKCKLCLGTLVPIENDVKRIISRHEVEFSDRIKRIAQGVMGETGFVKNTKINRDPKTLHSCPKCNDPAKKMNRMFYTEMYRIEIDRCIWCGAVWFDKDELEVLQYLIESVTKV